MYTVLHTISHIDNGNGSYAQTRPPRSSTRTLGHSYEHEEESNLLNRLMSMGFPQNRSEKAIATTGSLKEDDIGDCVNWLLAHVDDPSLDELDSRDYILYLCPASGQLAEILAKFWTDSKVAAPNGAHDSFPHIRLTTFFRVPDGLMPKLLQVIESTIASCEYVKSNYELGVPVAN
ncbi:hypothetical protein EB796_010319 [Bugula neritina]|uniref:UBA domain-containing protein n=1 Tax=Bugula neritina TaxID=10212 RepID=A0A7J7JZH5_BUGNE|nr:hypothetical protein EB796_010319 [Bugula neritina]